MRGIAVRSRTEEDTRDRGEVFFFVFLFLARSHGFRQPFLFSFHFVVCELKKKRRWNCFCASERVRDGRGMVPFVFCFSFLFQTESKSFLSGGIFAIVSLFCFFFLHQQRLEGDFFRVSGFFFLYKHKRVVVVVVVVDVGVGGVGDAHEEAEWTRMCRLRLPDCEKRNKQSLHWYGFSPLWMRMCFVNVEESEKACVRPPTSTIFFKKSHE